MTECQLGGDLNIADLLLPQAEEDQYSVVGVGVGAEAQAAEEDLHLQEENEAVVLFKGDDPFLRLPTHLTAFIAERLHFFDYSSFRETCKTFYSAAPRRFKYCRTSSFPFLIMLGSIEYETRVSCHIIDP